MYCRAGDGWRETMSEDRHDRAAASDTSRPRGRASELRGHRGGGGWGSRSNRGPRRQQCETSAVFLSFCFCNFMSLPCFNSVSVGLVCTDRVADWLACLVFACVECDVLQLQVGSVNKAAI